jgi:hypothetical protein
VDSVRGEPSGLVGSECGVWEVGYWGSGGRRRLHRSCSVSKTCPSVRNSSSCWRYVRAENWAMVRAVYGISE